jgi:hypothetical protein
LMPSASWAIFRFSRISFISAAVFGSSFIKGLKNSLARTGVRRPRVQSYHAFAPRKGFFEAGNARKQRFSGQIGDLPDSSATLRRLLLLPTGPMRLFCRISVFVP